MHALAYPYGVERASVSKSLPNKINIEMPIKFDD